MDVQAILDDIDRQFAQIRRVRELFVSIMANDAPPAKRASRPKGSANKTPEASAPTAKKEVNTAKHTMSAEVKARIAAAQKQAQEPATRKYAVKPKRAGKKATLAKTTPSSEIERAAEGDA